VLDVGQCQPDHSAIRRLIEREFQAKVVQAHSLDDALGQLRSSTFSLVLVNRQLDADYSDGLDVIRAIKADPQFAYIPCMLVTNYPEHQQAAVAAGAEEGFGKASLNAAETYDRLARFLS
jgi:two-component system chemotaxis response regulator CheY